MRKEIVEKVVDLPEGFAAEIADMAVTIKGNGNQVARRFKANGISFRQEGKSLVIVGKPASRKMNALAGTISSQIRNIVRGLECQYTYKMAVVFSHFPMNVTVKGNTVEINNFVGEKKARLAKIVKGASVEVKGKAVVVKSHDKEAAGQTATNIEAATKVRGKDKRIYQDGIFIVEKAVQESKESKKDA